jgi:hypothetical protein
MNATQTLAARDGVSPPTLKLAAVAALAALGDYLAYGHYLGLGAALFVGAVETIAVCAADVTRRATGACTFVALATLAPFAENPSVLSIAIAAFGAGEIALIANGGARGDFVEQIFRVLQF